MASSVVYELTFKIYPVEKSGHLIHLILLSNICSYFLTTVFNFLQVDGLNSLHSVKSTPNRFTKTSQGRSWNTGNGSPDAICFSVDKPGVVVVGFSVYGGGGIHEYELEVLVDDVSTAFRKKI